DDIVDAGEKGLDGRYCAIHAEPFCVRRLRPCAGAECSHAGAVGRGGRRAHAGRVWPSPQTVHVVDVSSGSPIGPRACSFWVEMPISAPIPNCSPSVKAVEVLTMTAAASTRVVNSRAAARSAVTIDSVWPVP